MNQYIVTQQNRFHWRLLITVSTFALLGAISTEQKANADENASGQSDLRAWLVIGGEWSTYGHDDTEWFAPGLATHPVNPGTLTFGPLNGWESNAEVAFEPAGTDWIFSATVEYGRSITRKQLYHETFLSSPPNGQPFQRNLTGHAKHNESHTIVDFEAGRDFGLGIFGAEDSSVVGAGIRMVQFGAQTTMQQDNLYPTGSANIGRKFVGIGPEVSWDASVPLPDSIGPGTLSFDWNAHGAVLFGRQKNSVLAPYQSFYASRNVIRRKAATVPNVGGSAALSWHVPSLSGKVSAGFRADAFFGVLDGGYFAPRKIDRVFFGPFINVGIETD